MTTISEVLRDGETIHARLPLRTGGSVALTDDSLLVVTDESSEGGPDLTRVALADVAEVTVEEYDYFLAVLSVLLVGYGLYSVPRSAPVGFAFAGFGAASLYWTYRKRGKARITVEGRAKPISVFPADTDGFTNALRPLLEPDSAESETDESDGSE